MSALFSGVGDDDRSDIASSTSPTRVVGFGKARSGARGRSTSPKRGDGLNPQSIPSLTMSVVSSSMNSESPQSGGAPPPLRGRTSAQHNRQDNRPISTRSSLSDDEIGEGDEDGEDIPTAHQTALDEAVFRRLYISSDFSARMATHRTLSNSLRGSGRGMTCKHGLKYGVCTENECCEIVSATIVRSDKRLSGKFTGRKLVEYEVAVVFENCKASVWHRYSGFRSFYEAWVLKHGVEMFSMFPRKHVNKWARAVTEERIVMLNKFLEVIINDDELRKDDLFKSFLSVDEAARRQFYEPSQSSMSAAVEIRELSKELDLKLKKTKESVRGFTSSKNAPAKGEADDSLKEIERTIQALKEAKAP